MADKRPATALAIIIPAFRGRHLAEALRSIAAQTDRRFRVYVGDDGSPEPLQAVVDAFRGELDLRYERFQSNLGNSNLVAHWDRCIALSKTESWL